MKRIIFLLGLLAFAFSACKDAGTDPQQFTIKYVISFDNCREGEIKVQLRCQNLIEDSILFKLPDRSKEEDNAISYISDFVVTDSNGHPVKWKKRGTNA